MRTIVAEPLSGDLCEVVKTIILARRANILGTVKNKLGEILNSSKSEYNPNLTVCIPLAGLKLIISNEASMVENATLLTLHQRLKVIFVTPNSKLFAGVSILAFGDLYRLPFIWERLIFENYKNNGYNL